VDANNKIIKLKIDGIEVNAKEGTSIYDVTKKIDVKIPTLCHNPALEPYGACRICSVEITDNRERKKIVTSCNYPVSEGLVVDTKSKKTMRIRQLLLELLIARCPNSKRIQDLAHEYNVKEPIFWIGDVSEDCILCGLCARVCEEKVGVSAINFANRGVEREVTAPYHTISDDCVGCGACAIVCPTNSKKVRINTYPMLEEDYKEIEGKFLTGKPDDLLGVYTKIFSAKSSIAGQDGGVATALLLSGFKRSLFDAAIVVKRTIGYKAEAAIAENSEEILNARGTKYSRVKMMSKIGELVERGKRKIALVGVPCEVRTARKIQQQMLDKYPDLEIIIIGLFCFEAFNYEKLKEETKKILNIDLDKAEKTQIQKGKFIVQIKGIEYSSAIQAGCAYCGDFSSNLADVSVGSVGSDAGYSTIVVRSTIGANLVNNLNLTMGDIRKEEIIKLANLKKKRANKNFDPIIEAL
jgi:coenzyme F420-reducing hydrogenase beta subunit